MDDVEQYCEWTGSQWKVITKQRAGLLLFSGYKVSVGKDFYGINTIFIEKANLQECEISDIREMPINEDNRDVINSTIAQW